MNPHRAISCTFKKQPAKKFRKSGWTVAPQTIVIGFRNLPESHYSPELGGRAFAKWRPTMKHQTLDQLKVVAGVDERYPNTLSRTERLIRWAERLESYPTRRLFTLHQTEHQSASVRDEMRGPDTAISIAFRDPVLRASGLANDTYGEAKRFFELTDRQLHDVICYCHYGETVSAATAARNVRAIVEPGLLARLRGTFIYVRAPLAG